MTNERRRGTEAIDVYLAPGTPTKSLAWSLQSVEQVQWFRDLVTVDWLSPCSSGADMYRCEEVVARGAKEVGLHSKH